MKIRRFIFLCIAIPFLLQASRAAAQKESHIHKIAIFAPLYLDSAFDQAGEYRYAKNSFPKFFNPGLEFYEGAQLALDSLAKEKLPLEVYVFDTRSGSETLARQLKSADMDSVELILAHCSSNEIKAFAETGLQKNIPVINVNLPNDGGITGNPFYVVLNSTLKTQCEGIYKYLQKNYSINPIVVFRKKGSMEDRIKSYFDDFGKTTAAVPLTYKYVNLPDSFSVNELKPLLDTLTHTVCIAGSLDENFGMRLITELSSIAKEYPVTLVGMPTWDGFNLNKPELKDVEIIYSTPFYNTKLDKASQQIIYEFNKKMFARPSDMIFRGYEATWKYVKQLIQFGPDIASNLTTKQAKVFVDFDIQPILNKQSMTLDYFENKKLYFIKWQDGVVKGVY